MGWWERRGEILNPVLGEGSCQGRLLGGSRTSWLIQNLAKWMGSKNRPLWARSGTGRKKNGFIFNLKVYIKEWWDETRTSFTSEERLRDFKWESVIVKFGLLNKSLSTLLNMDFRETRIEAGRLVRKLQNNWTWEKEVLNRTVHNRNKEEGMA